MIYYHPWLTFSRVASYLSWEKGGLLILLFAMGIIIIILFICMQYQQEFLSRLNLDFPNTWKRIVQHLWWVIV